MPKLYRGQGPVRFRGDPLSLRPEIAQEVAIAIAAHCKAEAMLATALAKKLKVDEAVFFELYLGYPNHQREADVHQGPQGASRPTCVWLPQ